VSPSGAQPASSYLVKGDDASLVAQAVRSLLADLVGDRDHALVVEESGGGIGDDLNVGAVVDACLTPPFLIDRRVVVVRDAGRLLTADVPRLIEAINDPLPTTILVLVAGGGTIPAPVVRAVQSSGQVVDVSTGRPADRKQWLSGYVRHAPVKLNAQALALLGQHVGEDLGRVEGLLSALAAAYGQHALITAEDLEPYLGEAGNVPRYELTDAIDRGEVAVALRVLHRMLDAGGLAGLQVVATLHGHFANMLALDGSTVSDEREAAQVLGISAYPAKKALEQSRRLGSARIAQAIAWLARADLDLKGESGLPSGLVVEILVARLARQTRPRTASRR
jgi:DNA polymerase III subunit delta